MYKIIISEFVAIIKYNYLILTKRDKINEIKRTLTRRITMLIFIWKYEYNRIHNYSFFYKLIYFFILNSILIYYNNYSFLKNTEHFSVCEKSKRTLYSWINNTCHILLVKLNIIIKMITDFYYFLSECE